MHLHYDTNLSDNNCILSSCVITERKQHPQVISRFNDSQHRSIAFISSAQYGHFGGDKARGNTSRRPLISRRQINTAWRTQPDVWSQWCWHGQWISPKKEAAKIPNYIHEFSIGRTGESFFTDTLSWCFHKVINSKWRRNFSDNIFFIQFSNWTTNLSIQIKRFQKKNW